MLKTAKFSTLGVTKGKKYLVTPTDKKQEYFKLRNDQNEEVIRHKSLFE